MAVFYWTAPRVRGHVLLCMLAYYLEWHMRQRLADAAASLFQNQILNVASTGHDGGAEDARGPRVRVRAAAPAVVGSHQLEANLVFKHVRRWIELNVHRAPQGDAYRCAVWRRG